MLASVVPFTGQSARNKISGRFPNPWINDSDTSRLPPATRFLQQVYQRIKVECIIQWPMLKTRWKTIILCLIFQYVHGIFTQLAARLHRPGIEGPLRDSGFMLTPELGPKHFWVSEMLFATLFGGFVVWIASPFFLERSKHFYTVVVVKRVLVHIVCCQSLRIISFLSTMLPGPAHHCRRGEPSANREWVHHWWDHLIVDVGKQSGKSCGDLLFSSHTTFILAFVLCYTYYGRLRVVKIIAWLLAGILSILIIASRKHYTVDVVVAWYTVPLVFLALERRWVVIRVDQELGSQELLQEMSPHQEVVISKKASISDGLDRVMMMMNGEASGLDTQTQNQRSKFSSETGTSVLSLASSGTQGKPDRLAFSPTQPSKGQVRAKQGPGKSQPPGRTGRLTADHRRQPSRDQQEFSNFATEVADDMKVTASGCIIS